MKTQEILLMIQPTVENAYWTKRMTDGIRDAASSIHLPVTQCRQTPPEHCVLIAGTGSSWQYRHADEVLENGGIPIFVNAGIYPSITGCSAVEFALEDAVKNCVDYFRALGGQRPALVGLNPESAADDLKRNVFETYTRKCGLDSICLGCGSYGLEASVSQIVDILLKRTDSDSKYDSLLCSNDTTAILLISELKKRGIPVGANYPVIGMGNSYLGQQFSPTVTTVDFDYYFLGREAVRLYEFLSDSPLREAMTLTLPTTLCIRESTGNIPFHTPRLLPPSEQSPHSGNYFTGDEVQAIIRLENYLQNCDTTDRAIIFAISDRPTYATLAESLFISERTVKYRISHISEVLDCHSKKELEDFIARTLSKN